VYERLYSEGEQYYERREQELSSDVLRQVERQVMLRIIDQKWREHLYEMDYLQEGIGLRAMGQKDPLVEWQRDGFAMFEQMMHSISQDFVKYVMHIQVRVEPTVTEGPRVQETQVTGPAEPGTTPHQPGTPEAVSRPAPAAGDGNGEQAPTAPDGASTPAASLLRDDAAAAGPQGVAQKPEATTPMLSLPDQPRAQPTSAGMPVTKDERDKLGRNDPCWCGSSKKFKHCHGR
jgi:preprotein translocase subunit SecA